MADLKVLTSSEFRNFQQLIYEMSGIRIPDTKLTLLSNRVRRRLKVGGHDNFQSYFQHLKSPQGHNEISGFLDAVTTNETFFFRTEQHFDWLRSRFVAEMVAQQRGGQRDKKLRIWSAACSTGEEPYSIAMCLAENQLRLRDWKLEVVATDLSEDALQSARQGVFKERAFQNLDDKHRRRYFTKRKDESLWEIKPRLRELVSFVCHNLMKPLSLPPFDCVFIRNVLIYFDRDSKQQVVNNLIRAMADGGYLVVGPSEGIYDMLPGLTKHSTFLYQK